MSDGQQQLNVIETARAIIQEHDRRQAEIQQEATKQLMIALIGSTILPPLQGTTATATGLTLEHPTTTAIAKELSISTPLLIESPPPLPPPSIKIKNEPGLPDPRALNRDNGNDNGNGNIVPSGPHMCSCGNPIKNPIKSLCHGCAVRKGAKARWASKQATSSPSPISSPLKVASGAVNGTPLPPVVNSEETDAAPVIGDDDPEADDSYQSLVSMLIAPTFRRALVNDIANPKDFILESEAGQQKFNTNRRFDILVGGPNSSIYVAVNAFASLDGFKFFCRWQKQSSGSWGIDRYTPRNGKDSLKPPVTGGIEAS